MNRFYVSVAIFLAWWCRSWRAWALGCGATAAMLCAGLAAAAPSTEPLRLTPPQQAWVKAHPVLRVGVAGEYPPYYFVPQQPSRRPYGFIVQVMDLWAERLQLKIEFVRFASHAEALLALQNREVDLLPGVLPLNAAQAQEVVTLPVLSSDLVLVARRDVPDISATDNFGQYRIATVADSAATQILAQRFPQARVSTFATPEQALRAVASGDAELFIGRQQLVVYHIEKLLLANLVIRRNLGPGNLPIGPAMRRDASTLRGLLELASASVTAADRSDVATRWLPASQAAAAGDPSTALTPAERDWVQRSGRIRVGFDAWFSPLSRRADLGEPEGLAIDYMRLLAQKTGLSIVSESGGTFAEMYDKAGRGDVDVMVGMVRTHERRADFDFVGPFVRVPTAFVMRVNDRAMVTETRELVGRRVALLKEHFLISELQARHPGIQLVEFDHQDDALMAVSGGKADVALGNVKVVNELIENRFAGRLRITGTVAGGDSELYLGVRRGLPELTQVLRKGLDAVSDEESSAISQRWMVVNVRPGLNWRRVLAWGGPLLLAVLAGLAVLWRSNRRLAAAKALEAQARQAAEAATQERGQFLAYLSHELRGALGAVACGAELLREDITHGPTSDGPNGRLLDAMAQSARGLTQVLESTLVHEQNLAKPLVLKAETVGMQNLWAQLVAPGVLLAARKGLIFEAHFDAPDVPVRVDATRLQQVVGNLLQNAVKYTAEGVVAIAGRWLPPGAGAVDAEGAEARLFEITVRDSGPGLAADELARIFEPYAQGAQGERLGQGVGLGLAVSRQIVNAMGGELLASSPGGQGAVFCLRVPMALG